MQSRDFIYVSDVITGLTRAMKLLRHKPASYVCNLCTGKQKNLSDVISELHSITRQHTEVHFEPARLGDVRVSLGDTKLMEKLLQISTPIELGEGLRELWGFQKINLDATRLEDL